MAALSGSNDRFRMLRSAATGRGRSEPSAALMPTPEVSALKRQPRPVTELNYQESTFYLRRIGVCLRPRGLAADENNCRCVPMRCKVTAARRTR